MESFPVFLGLLALGGLGGFAVYKLVMAVQRLSHRKGSITSAGRLSRSDHPPGQ